MITAILPVSYSGGFENLKRNIIGLSADLERLGDVLCIVSDKNLYLECRDILKEYEPNIECLTVYSDRQYPIREALNYLGDKNEYVFVVNENLYLPPKTISRLYEDYLDHPKAGFIAGHFTEYPIGYWVDDIYSETPKVIYSNERELELLQEVDLVLPPYGLLTRTNTFKELFFKGSPKGAEYGLNLRKQGYKNYIDTAIKLNYGTEVNNENNNVEGLAR